MMQLTLWATTLWASHTVMQPHCDTTHIMMLPHCNATHTVTQLTLWRNSHHDASHTVTQFIMVCTLFKTDSLVWKAMLYLFQIKSCPFCYLRSCCFFIWNVLAYLQVIITDSQFLSRKKTFWDQDVFFLFGITRGQFYKSFYGRKLWLFIIS